MGSRGDAAGEGAHSLRTLCALSAQSLRAVRPASAGVSSRHGDELAGLASWYMYLVRLPWLPERLFDPATTRRPSQNDPALARVRAERGQRPPRRQAARDSWCLHGGPQLVPGNAAGTMAAAAQARAGSHTAGVETHGARKGGWKVHAPVVGASQLLYLICIGWSCEDVS
jgi:hypothetical protein